jgi:hypothetical protein
MQFGKSPNLNVDTSDYAVPEKQLLHLAENMLITSLSLPMTLSHLAELICITI